MTVSSGNHAQGLALACRLLGCSAHVAMPKASSSVKQEAARSYGAHIHEAVNRARAVALVDRLARELPAAIIHPFNDPLVIAGQGTVMTELLEQVADLDVVLAPIGGGGLSGWTLYRCGVIASAARDFRLRAGRSARCDRIDQAESRRAYVRSPYDR